MPTAAERQALAFVAVIALLGAGVRVAAGRQFLRDVDVSTGGALSADSGSPAALALAHQLTAVDSARSARQERTRAQKARSGASGASLSRTNESSEAGQLPKPSREGMPGGIRDLTQAPININRATAAELELLPRVGPTLAKRIVAWRETHGPFESIEALRHVPGIGVTTSARLAPLVTF